NASFAFAIVGAFDPGYVGVSGTFGYVSSFAGLDSTDATNGYSRNASSGGSMRVDLMTVVPEPSTFAMLGTAAMVGGSVAWRWQRRRRRVAA
ncbi:MAG: PEP-CTERM sorting domain-containing protein, partial [Planctomycetaceae bacterium]